MVSIATGCIVVNLFQNHPSEALRADTKRLEQLNEATERVWPGGQCNCHGACWARSRVETWPSTAGMWCSAAQNVGGGWGGVGSRTQLQLMCCALIVRCVLISERN